MPTPPPPPKNLIITAGTYDGVLLGWSSPSSSPSSSSPLQLTFATPAHSGSIRSLSLSPSSQSTLLSCGYDETLRLFSLSRSLELGEARTPSFAGGTTPLCSAFAPPREKPTHALIGFATGKIFIYKVKDWSVVHVLSGHEEKRGGCNVVSVHPSGKMALSGGGDGTLRLWDLMKGRLSFVYRLGGAAAAGSRVESILWNGEGTSFGYCYGHHVTIRDVGSGEDLLDVDLDSRVNEMAFLNGGAFVACACDDGSLVIMSVGLAKDGDDGVRGLVAIEPVTGGRAGEERLKCMTSVDGGRGTCVVVGNSGGVVSVLELKNAITMMMEDDEEDVQADLEAVQILDTVKVGTGARITSLAAWRGTTTDEKSNTMTEETTTTTDDKQKTDCAETTTEDDDQQSTKNDAVALRQQSNKNNKRIIEMDSKSIENARSLVQQAKKRKKRRDKKTQKTAESNS